MSLSRAIALAFAVAHAEVAGAEETARSYELDVAYTGEIWRNTRGGLRSGSSYLDNLDVQLTVDGENAWGIPGLTVFGYLLHNNGGTVSDDLVGDAQGVSNIEAIDQVRLYELWADWSFGPQRAHSLRMGLYDLNSEFDASEVGALFINSAHGIGTQIGQTGANGPSIFPVTSLALRFRWQPSSAFALQLAGLDGVPGDPAHPASNSVHLGGGDGALLAAEAGWNGGRVRKAAIGGWRYTSRFDHLSGDTALNQVRTRGNEGIYALIEARLWSSAEGGPRALDGYARYGTADARINRFHEAWAFGVVATGLTGSRPQDRLGLAVAAACNGAAHRRAEELSGQRVVKCEYATELTYRAEVSDWLVLQPTVQHIVNPDTRADRDDALAIALRFELAWGAQR